MVFVLCVWDLSDKDKGRSGDEENEHGTQSDDDVTRSNGRFGLAGFDGIFPRRTRPERTPSRRKTGKRKNRKTKWGGLVGPVYFMVVQFLF